MATATLFSADAFTVLSLREAYPERGSAPGTGGFETRPYIS
jgi:hypothetical protein